MIFFFIDVTPVAIGAHDTFFWSLLEKKKKKRKSFGPHYVYPAKILSVRVTTCAVLIIRCLSSRPHRGRAYQ